MKFLKIVIFIFLIFFTKLVSAWYNYPYVCGSLSCYTTELKELNKFDGWHFLTNETISYVPNLSDYLDSKLQDLNNYYWTSTFTIDNYYIWTWSLSNKDLTLDDLLKITTAFYIWKNVWWNVVIVDTYVNWYDYLYSNFTDTINQLHVWFPVWTKKNKLSDLLKNIVYYDNNTKLFSIKNVCDDSTCEKTRYKWISYNITNPYYFLTWTIKPNYQFVLDTFKVSNDYSISHIYLKAWWTVDFNFWFEDYLDVWSSNTKYKYTISYKYDWGIIQDLFSETIKIWNDFSVTSDTITQPILDDIIDLTVLKNKTKKIRVWVKESIKLTKVGQVTFYLAVENLNTWDKFNTTAINEYSPLYVIPNDDVKNWDATIIWFSKSSNDSWYNVWDTFSVTLNLRDEYNNDHYDYIDWYDISLDPGSSNFIELSKAWSSVYSTSLTWVNSSSSSPYPISFKFRITKAGYHELNWFKVKIRTKQSSTSYTSTPTYTYFSIIPSNLYDGEQKMKIYIKSPLITDFPISCTNWSITLKTLCTSDNFSWCNASKNQSITFTNESDNGSMWVLSISDYAYNVKNYNYTMNHIDKTAPVISIFKDTTILNLNSYKFKANNDDLKINFYEKTTSNCSSEINYLVKINWVIIYNSLAWTSNFDATISNFFKSTWSKELYIKATDKYWNFNEKIINFSNFPDEIDPTKTTITSTENWNKYANNSDYYIYTISLKDKYNNPIYNKVLNFIDQDCTFYSGCYTLKTNMWTSIPSWDDALNEYLYSTPSNWSWEINFRVKSISPWVFTNRFKIQINDWDDNYNNISALKNYYIADITQNSFKKLFTWDIFASDDDWATWSALPEYGTEMKFKLVVKPISSVWSLGVNIWNFKTSIRAIDLSSSEVQGVSNISWLNTKTPTFTAKINTSATATTFWNPWLQISDNSNLSNVVISYIMWWKTVSSYLSTLENWDDRTPISIENSSWNVFIWIEVIWTLQWWWKSEFTWQEANFSDISKSETRTVIRKNAFTQIKNMTSGQIVNWVKYVVWDINLSWEISWYETLIVKDWNVIINWDLNNSWKKLWIIVLKDSYNINSDYTWKWNVYVNQNVSKINAVIYADGWFISSNISWVPYTIDNTTRTIELKNQLYMKWSLFTRNTIGWAILAGWDFILPGWSKIAWVDANFDKAMIYDLNYVRRWKQNCLELSPWVCKYNKWAFVIEYDSKIQTDPPKVFSNK